MMLLYPKGLRDYDVTIPRGLGSASGLGLGLKQVRHKTELECCGKVNFFRHLICTIKIS